MENKKAINSDENLEESKEFLKLIINSANDGILASDIKTKKFVFANPKICEITGYSKKELLNMGIDSILPKKDLPYALEQIEKQIKKEITISENIPILKKNKEIIYCDIGSNTLKIKDKELIIGFFRDISERKKSEENLKDSELKFKIIFENSIDGILIADLKTKKFLIGNNEICKMLGYNKEEIKNLSVSDIHPKESLPYVQEQFEKQARKEIIIAQNLPIKRKDGSIFYADVGAAPFDLGEKKYMLGTFRDITKRKKSEEKLKVSEEKYRSIIENAEDWIFVLDKNYKFISANPKIASLLRTTPDKMIGKSLLDFFPKEISLQFSKNIQEVFVTAKIKFIEEKMIIGNKEFYISTVLNPIKDNNGNALAVMGITRDITKQKQAEKEIKERTEGLEKFNKLAVGRELKMVNLKKEINELCKKLGEKEKYEIS